MPTPLLSPRALTLTKNNFYQSSIFSYRGRRAVAVIVTALLLPGCQLDAATTDPETARPVQVQRVAFTTDGAERDFVGVVRARHETDLGFRVAGKIGMRLVSVGDRVRAGQTVARLDPQDLRLQVQIAEAELASAKSSLAQAASDLARYATLKASGFASVADFDRKTAAKDEAKGRLDRAVRSLELARNQLGYAELKANADGVVTAAPAEPGQVVAIGQPVVRLAVAGEKEAQIALPEGWLDEARRSHATVRLWSNQGRSYNAHLRELSPQADPATRTYAARFTIDDADDTVALGMTATVTLTRGGGERVAKLPLSAVLNRGSGPAVYVVDDTGKLSLRPVAVASFNEQAALVSAGVAPGESVVSLGVQKLHAGQRVRTVEIR